MDRTSKASPRMAGGDPSAGFDGHLSSAETDGPMLTAEEYAAMERELLEELESREPLQSIEEAGWAVWQEALRLDRLLPREDTRRLRRRFRWLPREIGCPRGWRRLLDTFCRTVRHQVPADELWPRGPVRATRISACHGVLTIEFEGIAAAAPWSPLLNSTTAYLTGEASSSCETCGEDGEILDDEGSPWVVCPACMQAHGHRLNRTGFGGGSDP